MDILERRALLGDRKAQKECTEKGIVLPCPFCKGHAGGLNATILKWANTDSYVHERTGKCFLDGIIIGNLAEWNTRPAPFIRLCKDCSYKQKARWKSRRRGNGRRPARGGRADPSRASRRRP